MQTPESSLQVGAAPVVIMIPVYNEWNLAQELLARLDRALAAAGQSAAVIFIDDGSPQSHAGRLDLPANLRAISAVQVLLLARNLGHQRAIAIGLTWLAANRYDRVTAIMDGDGEDDPQDVPRLINTLLANPDHDAVFAARTRRSESLLFQFCYRTYQVAHLILTGLPVRFGNFSAIRPAALKRLALTGEIWNHYAAAVVYARIPLTTIPTIRAPRLGGKSSMNFVSLVVHGLSALSIFAPLIGVRVMSGMLLLGIGAVLLCLLLWVFGQRETYLAFSAYWFGVIGVVIFQQIAIISALVLMLLAGRTGMAFLPIRDYQYFIDRVVTLVPPKPQTTDAGGIAGRVVSAEHRTS